MVQEAGESERKEVSFLDGDDKPLEFFAAHEGGTSDFAEKPKKKS